MMRRRPLLLGLGAGWWLDGQAAGAPTAASAAPTSAEHAAPGVGHLAPAGARGGAGRTGAGDASLSDAPLVFPRDHGSHPETRVEWWYVTGVLRTDEVGGGTGPSGDRAGAGTAAPASLPAFGFQLTFFRLKRSLRQPLESRFAPHQLMLGHVALSDLTTQRLVHDQRLLRQGFANARADEADAHLRLGDWTLERRDGPQGLSRYRLALRSEPAGFALSLDLAAAQRPLLQGRQGWSQKGPQAQQASRYVSEPQLSGRGRLALSGQPARAVQARCWLDHEWSNAYLGQGDEDAAGRAVGWDWLGINLDDGTALTLFQMRHRDGRPLWTGGSWRDATGRQDDLQQQLVFEPLAWWQSPSSLARYPVRWRIRTPKGTFLIDAAFNAQEVDARRSTGFLYWEGASRVSNEAGDTIGWGYLEMTGYAGKVPL